MKISRPKLREDSLEEALLKCCESAQLGYKIARQNLKETSKAIENVTQTLHDCLEKYEDGTVRTTGIVEQLRNQLLMVIKELNQLQVTAEKDLEEKRKRLDTFSITLFGRTMAGKSTLMEILTKGKGESIGLGAQRTTRDVRKYLWNGLEVTDVPGIAAFEGEEDEELAFKSAAQADLVLFMITDDAPQPAEAECLARIIQLGKPVIGICNVKAAVDDEDDLVLFLRKSDYFNRNRLNELVGQLYDFTDEYVPGKRIPFIFTHLRSRFLADNPNYTRYRESLLKASHFDELESRIINEVRGRGVFLRTKSFIDSTTAQMMEIIKNLLDFSAQNSASGRVLIEKRRQFQSWSQIFMEDSRERINTFVSQQMDHLRNDVSDFAEEHYEDKYAGEKWDKHIQSTGLNEKAKRLQEKIQEDCRKALNEVARELEKELKFVAEFSGDRSIKMNGVFDTKRWWNWGTSILSGGIGLAAVIIGSGPLGWAAAGVGLAGWLISLLFDDREKKARKRRVKLSKALYDNIDKIEKNLKRQLHNWLNNEVLSKQINMLLNDFGVVTSSIFELADAQRTLAWKLNLRQKELGHSLIEEALRNCNGAGMEYHIRDLARIPGFATIFLVAPDTYFPDDLKKGLRYLLDESIWFVIDTGNQKSILSQAIGRGCDRNKISIEAKLNVAHIPLNDIDAMTLMRVKLAQQLTGLHVML
ncbi:GTPase [Neobacillus sp. 114]|uniref:GTPase n=1 Tax=Neobacillus sp. 114 TaxID=3048535 RepID=UPI0024C2652D|nr:GTPase [Neobacillus sp. 114]